MPARAARGQGAQRSLASRVARQGVNGLGATPSKRALEGRTAILPPTDVHAVLNGLREAAFQRIVRGTLTTLGYVVWVFPVMKRTTAGVPDLTFWHPQRPGRLYCWELKTQKGRVRPGQVVAITHLATVPGIDARIVRPADWPALRDELIRQAVAAGEG